MVPALLDTGSSVTLCNSELLPKLKEYTNRLPKRKLDLRSANGDLLRIQDHRQGMIVLNNRHTSTDIVFINNLQVPCILGMDYLQAAGIVIDTGAKRLHFKPAYTDQPYDNAFNISIKTDQDITLQPMEETKIIFNTPAKLYLFPPPTAGKSKCNGWLSLIHI